MWEVGWGGGNKIKKLQVITEHLQFFFIDYIRDHLQFFFTKYKKKLQVITIIFAIKFIVLRTINGVIIQIR